MSFQATNPGVVGHEPRVAIEPQPAGPQVTRILGCSCGWQVPPGTSESDTAFAWHAAAAAPDDPTRLQQDLVQRAIAHVLSDREADQRSIELARIEEAVAEHLRRQAGQPPSEEALALLQSFQRAQALFHLSDQHANRCHEALRHAARQIVDKLETMPNHPTTDQEDLLLVAAAELPQLDDRFLAEARRHYALGTVVLELDGTHDGSTLDWLARLTKTIAPAEPRRPRPVVVVIPPRLMPDRETRDRIVSAGGMPLYAPRSYDEGAPRDVRRTALSCYLKELRAATSFRDPRPYPEELRQTVRRPPDQLEKELPADGPSTIDLWRAINAYAVACGGDPSRGVQGNLMRQAAVVEIERHFSLRRTS